MTAAGIDAGRRKLSSGLLAVLGWALLPGVLHAADKSVPVYFSHFYVDLDKDTFHRLQESTQIQEFADHELAHRSDGQTQYTGFYLRGRHTYMEFFGDPLPEGDRVGNVGLGFAVEKPGGVRLINERLRKIFGEQAKLASTTYPIGAGAVPWYTATYVDAGRSADILSAWIAEVDPGYLAARHPGVRIEDPLSREKYLSWDFKEDRLLDDVVALTLDLPSQEATQLSKQLAGVGWSVHTDAQGTYTARGPDMRLTVRTVGAGGGLRAAELRLLRSVASRHVELGTASLDLNGTSGRLVFMRAD